jgi:sialate O-acetylesterase
VKNTGMAVTIDIGEAKDIHPHNKQDVGKRLARWALAKTYGKDVAACGPLYKAMRTDGDKIVLEFDYAGCGLAVRDGGKLKGFAIAGADKKFVWADAQVVGNTVVVCCPGVKSPAAVRYAWANNPDCNLINKCGLPASPFRTDDWAQ